MKAVQLGDVVSRIDYGFTASATKEETGVRFLRITDLGDDGVDWSTVPYCDPQGQDTSRFHLEPGDLVFARTGATTGKSYLLEEFPERSVFASYLIRVRPSAELHPAYLKHFCRSPGYWHQIAAQAVGAAQPGVNASKLKTLRLPLLPLDEQRRIAAILDKADAIRRKRQQTLCESEMLEQALFLSVVGPRADGYHNWAPASFEELAKPGKGAMRTGPFGSDLRHSEFVDEGVAVLGIDNAVQNRFAWAERRFITHEKYEKLTRYTVFPGDVIVTIMGTTGRSAVIPDDIPLAITTKHLATITPDRSKAEPEFLSNALHRHPAVLSQIKMANKGAIMDGLNLGIIKGLQVPLPPIEVQRRYVNDLLRVRSLQAKMRLDLEEAEALFASLSQRAFRGEL